jgi:hypothetical protein
MPPGTPGGLTRAEFEDAVREALRHYAQADLLAGNPLLQARLLTREGHGSAATPTLRALLAETTKTLFAGERDQRLYRVIELTYLSPAPKQEAAASRLGMSFSTYRRHLTAGVEQQEQEARYAPTPAVEGSAAVSPSPRPPLSISICAAKHCSRRPRRWPAISKTPGCTWPNTRHSSRI